MSACERASAVLHVATLLAAVAVAPLVHAATIAERYAASDDLSGFIIQRAALPAEGSYFYSYLARRECQTGTAVVRLLTAKISASALGNLKARISRQVKRCTNVPYLTDLPQALALQDADKLAGAAAGDKYFSVLAWTARGTLRMTDDADVRTALRFFASTDDRNMRAVELEFFPLATLTLGGQHLTSDQARAFRLALELTGCSLGVEAGGQARPIGGLHTLFGACDEGTSEGIRKRVEPLNLPPRPDWALIEAYQAQILAAVRSGDWSAYGGARALEAVPPSLPPPR